MRGNPPALVNQKLIPALACYNTKPKGGAKPPKPFFLSKIAPKLPQWLACGVIQGQQHNSTARFEPPTTKKSPNQWVG
jgi:hypothetical protein